VSWHCSLAAALFNQGEMCGARCPKDGRERGLPVLPAAQLAFKGLLSRTASQLSSLLSELLPVESFSAESGCQRLCANRGSHLGKLMLTFSTQTS